MDLQELLNHAWKLKKQGNYSDALEKYKTVLKTLESEAREYARNQEYTLEEVIEDGEKIEKVNPSYLLEVKEYLRRDNLACTILNNMGVIYAEVGDFDSAGRCFMDSIDLTPGNYDYKDPIIGLKNLQ